MSEPLPRALMVRAGVKKMALAKAKMAVSGRKNCRKGEKTGKLPKIGLSRKKRAGIMPLLEVPFNDVLPYVFRHLLEKRRQRCTGLGQEVIELIDFFELLFSVEEAELSVTHGSWQRKKVKRCAYLINFFPSVEDYQHGRGFLEVPTIRWTSYRNPVRHEWHERQWGQFYRLGKISNSLKSRKLATLACWHIRD